MNNNRHTRELQLATSQVFGLLLADIATSLGSLAVAFYYSWKLALVLLSTLPISVIILSIITYKIQPAIQNQKHWLAVASKHVTASIAAIDLVKVFNGYDEDLSKYHTAIKKAGDFYLIQAMCNSSQIGYVSFWVVAMFVVGFWYGLTLVNQGAQPGHILTAFYASLAAFQGIEALMPQWLVLSKGMFAGAFLSGLLKQTNGGGPEVSVLHPIVPEVIQGSIELTNVSNFNNSL